MDDEIVFKKENPSVRLTSSDSGFTLWIDGRWIIDASTIMRDNEFSISRERIKLIKTSEYHRNYKFVSDKKDNIKNLQGTKKTIKKDNKQR